MIDLNKEREAFEQEWIKLGGHLLYVEFTSDKMYGLSDGAKVLTENDKAILLSTINTAWAHWVICARQKQAEIDALKEKWEKSSISKFIVQMQLRIDELEEKLAKIENENLIPSLDVPRYIKNGEAIQFKGSEQSASQEWIDFNLEYHEEDFTLGDFINDRLLFRLKPQFIIASSGRVEE